MQFKIHNEIRNPRPKNQFKLILIFEADTGEMIEDETYLSTEEKLEAMIVSAKKDLTRWSTSEDTNNPELKQSLDYILVEMGVASEVRFAGRLEILFYDSQGDEYPVTYHD